MINLKPRSALSVMYTVGLGIFALSLGMGLSVFSSSTSQNQGKFFIKDDPSLYTRPLEVIQINTAKGKAQFHEGFLGSDDWFKNLELKIKNVFGEDIVFLVIELSFPDTLATGNKMVSRYNLGIRPDRETIEKKQEVTFLKPGEETTFTLKEADYEDLIKFLQKRQPLSTIHTMEINFKFVHFKNGLAWDTGQYLKPSPGNPNRYDPIDNPKPPNGKNLSKN
jgi:hypothetical protein